MFDVIGKRNWFFAFSLLITVPGLIFILLTPFSNGQAGLKFSIDYTGGTQWTVKFKDAAVTADAIKAELVTLGQVDATVTKTGRGYFDIRLSKLDLLPAPTESPASSAAPSGSPAPSASAAASPAPSASAAASASAGPSAASASAGSSASPAPSPTASPTPTPSPSASAAPSA